MMDAQTSAIRAVAEAVNQGGELSTAERLAQKLAARRAAKATAEANAAAPAVAPVEAAAPVESVNQAELAERIRQELMEEESAHAFLAGAVTSEIQRMPASREKSLRTHFAVMQGMEGMLARLQATETQSLDGMLGYQHQDDLRNLSDGALREALKADARAIIIGSVGEIAESCLSSEDTGMVAAGLAISGLTHLRGNPEIAQVIDEVTDTCSEARLEAMTKAIGMLDDAVETNGTGIRFGNKRVRVIQTGNTTSVGDENVDRAEARTTEERVQEFIQPQAGETDDRLLLRLVSAAVKAPPFKASRAWR